MVTEQLDAHLQMELPFREFQERLSMRTAQNESDDRSSLTDDQGVKNQKHKYLVTGPKAEY